MSQEREMRKGADGKTLDQESFDRLIGEIEKGLKEGTIEIPAEVVKDWDKNAREGTTSKGIFQIVQPGEAGGRTSQIPQERIEELADYYDRTDTAELEDGEDVTDLVQVDKPEDMEQISIRLPREDLEQIRRRAKAAGVGYTTMIRMIVHAHLENPLTY